MAGNLSWRWYQPVSYAQIWFFQVWKVAKWKRNWFSWDFFQINFQMWDCEYWQLRAVAWSPGEECDQNSTTNVFSYRRIAKTKYFYKFSMFSRQLFQSLTFFLNILIRNYRNHSDGPSIQYWSERPAWIGFQHRYVISFKFNNQCHSLVVNRSKIVVFWIC